jgi:hypothetical protein
MKKSITSMRLCLFSAEKQSQKRSLFVGLLTLIAFVLGPSSLMAQTTETFTTNGTFTPPAGVTSVQVRVWGAGGAGGGVDASILSNRAGGGGGGGGYSYNPNVAVSHPTPISVAVGNGGAGSNGGHGQNGQNSQFSSSVPVIANGGLGGRRGDGNTSVGEGGNGGSGATHQGGNGANATSSSNGTSGGGGGGAGSNAHGGSGAGLNGGLGGTPDGGNGGNGRSSNGNGSNGAAIGAGGGGGRSSGSSTDRRGGNGARGEVRVTYTCPSYQMTQSPTSNGPFCGVSPAAITLYSSSMASGSYTITYNLSGATSGSSLTANVTFTAGSPGTATFNTNNLNVGNTTVTITKITSQGCNNTVSTNNSVVVTVNPNLSAGVSISADDASVCPGGMITFTATPTNGGTSPSYQWKVNGSPVGTDSATYQSNTFVNGDSVTCEMTSNATPCLVTASATSNAIPVTIYPLPSDMSITPSSATVCAGSTNMLTANGGISAFTAYSQNFNGTHDFAIAGTVTGGGHAWQQQTSPYNVTLVANWNTTPDSGSMMVSYIGALLNSTSANTQLTSPAINAADFSNLNLSYRHTYKKGGESGVTVQVSTNNGSSWTTVKTYSSNQGSAGAFVTDNINLNSYAGSASLMVRFNYVASQSAFNTAWWAVDNVVLSGNGSAVIWSPTTGLYTDAAATIPYTGSPTSKVYAKTNSSTVYTATSASVNGCEVSAQTSLTVQDLPTLSGVAQAPSCQDSNATISLSGMPANGTFNIGYHINGGPIQNANGVTSDGSGNASFSRMLTLANNGQLLTIATIQRVDNSPSCAFVPTSNNTVSLVVNPNVTYYADADGDGFGNIAMPQVSCFGAPVGYVTNNTDCDDADDTINATYAFYADADGDGFGTGDLMSVCAVDSNTPPAGYSTNNTDCNDNDDTVNAMYSFYVDADADGFGTGGLIMVCAVDGDTPPAGYALNDSDCNDADANMHEVFSFYIDADYDGYGAGELIDGVCAVDAMTPPAGYSLVDTDCNDEVGSINPGMTEIPYNGVDDDCDGTIDEGSQIFSQVLPSQCGTTLVNIGSLIGCVSHGAATGYRFEVTNTTTNQTWTIDRGVPNFSLTAHLPQYDYATTYSIRVMVQRNYVWLNYYGESCLVASPAVTSPGGAAQVNPSQCGITLPTLSTLIATTSLPGVSSYRFRITDLSDADGPNQVQILDRGLHWFSLPMLTRYNYGTTYSIEVAIKTASSANYTGFGQPCYIYSPAVPSLALCDQIVPSKATNVATTSLNGATQYRFILTDMVTFGVTTIDRGLHWFRFQEVPGYVPGREYGVQVAVMTSGEWSPLSDGCIVTAPAAAKENVKESTVPFNAVAYPNPFADTFSLELTTSAESSINVKVYDMTGRVLEQKEVPAAEIQTLQVGETYPAGVYNVIVSQGNDTRMLRVIKR